MTNSRTGHYHLPGAPAFAYSTYLIVYPGGGGDSANERDGDARRKF